MSLDKVDAGFAITKIALKSEVAVPGIDASTFDGIIQKAKAGCPVSQVLKAEITLDYQFEIVKHCRMTRQARECLMRC
ncbi:peroxiredoxin (osmotically-inducible protein C) [Escherichia coli]|uniref:Peroxiredoxin (Osmotically-inducible protein C) n=1 Tax=Escherichia coli TaxID=562 RepID=A0A377DSM1_ECOLX|nr:peroxiredoxin (osmotically-inducible protein C) [Escherichia coli]